MTATVSGEELLRWFEVPLLAEDGSVAAVQRRQLYVRRRRGGSDRQATGVP